MGRKPKLNVATAKVTDGALKSYASVYDIIGFKTSVYRTSDAKEYSESIRKMNLPKLHDHAQEVGVVPVADYGVLLDRLDRKFLESAGRYAATKATSEISNKVVPNQQTLDILSRGRRSLEWN